MAVAELGQAPWVIGGDWSEEVAAIWSLVAADGRGLFLPRAAGADEVGTSKVDGRRIDFFVAAAALPGRVGIEEILVDAPLRPHKPARL